MAATRQTVQSNASTNVKTVYALISTEDFLAGVPNYQIFESLPRDEGGIL